MQFMLLKFCHVFSIFFLWIILDKKIITSTFACRKAIKEYLECLFFLTMKMNNNYAVLYVNYTVVFLLVLKVNSNFELHMNFCVLYFLHVFQSISIMYNWFRWFSLQHRITSTYSLFSHSITIYLFIDFS